MRKIILLLFLSLVNSASFAQEKLFKEALEKGLKYGTYVIENTKKKDISKSDVMNYAKTQGFIVGRISEVRKIRFGDVSLIVDKMEFIDPKYYPAYVFYSIAGSGVDFNSLKGKGSFYLPTQEKIYKESAIPFVSVLSGTRTNFNRYDNAMWSGNVSNGLIDGKGVGFIIMPKGKYIKFEGTFSQGFPTSEVIVKSVTKNDMNNAVVSEKEVQSSKYQAASRKSFAQNAETKDSELGEAIKQREKDMYKGDVAKLEEIYNKVKPITMTNYEKIPMDNFVSEFISLYQLSKYDPQNALPKAWEINDVYYVVEALKMQIRDRYYGYSAWSLLTLFYDWLDKYEKKDRELLANGLEKAQKGKNSKYGFSNFFSQAASLLSKKKADFENKISKDAAEYNSLVSKEKASRNKMEEELSKQIDTDRCKDPYGKLTSGLFDTYWYYPNEGEIRFKAGNEYVKYNVLYRDSKGEDLEGFSITYSTDKIRKRMGNNYYKHFQSRGALIGAILEAVY